MISLFKELVCFTSGAYDDVNTDKGIGYFLLNILNLVSKECRVISPMHKAQHFVAATLQRDVKVGHKSPGGGTKVEDFLCEQIGLNGRNAITQDSGNFVQLLNEVKKVLSRG